MTEESIHVQVNINDSSAQHRPVPDFPLDVLPFDIQALVVAAAKVYNVSIPIAALGVLMMAAAYLGRSRYIENAPYKTFAAMWLLLVARSGSGKSHLIARFFERLQLAEEQGLSIPSFITDFSMAGLLDNLEENRNGVFVLADEMSDVMQRIRRESGMAKLGTIYDHSPVAKVRSKKVCCSCSFDTKIPSPCMSLIGNIQPKRLPSLFSRNDIDGGFAARFLLGWAENGQTADIDTDVETLDHNLDTVLDQLHERLLGMQNASCAEGFFQPGKVVPDVAAQQLVAEWFARKEEERDARRNWFEESIYVKIPRQAMSAMLCLYALETCMSDKPETYIIGEELAAKGLRLADWLLTSQKFCWNFLDPHLKMEYTPVHSAIARAIVEHTEIPMQNKGIFPMPKLVDLVAGYMRFPESPNKIGMVANDLGLERRDTRNERGRLIRKPTLDRMAFVLEIAPRMADDDLLVADA